MININSIKTTYKSFNNKTKTIIRITLITTISLIIAAIFAYNSNEFDLMKNCDDMLEASKSVMLVGFAGALFFEYISKDEKK